MPIDRRLWAAVAFALASLVCPVHLRAQAPEFYAGKTLSIIVGFEAGGTADTFVRSIAAYLRKHTPGQPTIVVQNMTGAAGALAVNYLFEKAPRDGLTIVHQPWDPLAQALGSQGCARATTSSSISAGSATSA